MSRKICQNIFSFKHIIQISSSDSIYLDLIKRLKFGRTLHMPGDNDLTFSRLKSNGGKAHQ